MKDISIADIMSKHLITLHPKEYISQAKNIFHQFEFHHIPVAVMGNIVGIISLGDLLFLEKIVTNQKDPMLNQVTDHMVTVDKIMTKDPIHIPSTTLLSDALNILINKRINALPIVDNEELVGMITTFDILKHLQLTLNQRTE